MRCATVALVLAVAAGAGCDPEIGTGTYFCGAELLCPPDLECNPHSFTCETPDSFSPFSCPEGSEQTEPDGTVADAPSLGELSCNYAGTPIQRCAADAQDVDHLSFAIDECFGNDPHVEVEIRFPVGMARLELDILDDSEVVIASGEPCTPEQNFTGMDWLCASIPPVIGTYTVRVRATGEADCGGDCAFNQYLIYVRYPIT